MITKLEIIRKSQGYTQIELGKKIGYHASMISKYERGFVARISKNFKQKVSEELGKPIDKIFKKGTK